MYSSSYYCHVLMTFLCRQAFEKQKTRTSNLTKIRTVTAELFHADGRTDRRDKANSRFSQFF